MPAPENTANTAVRVDSHAIHGGDLLLSRVLSSCDFSFGYEQHGKVPGTRAPYDNRFVSIITVADRKIVH